MGIQLDFHLNAFALARTVIWHHAVQNVVCC